MGRPIGVWIALAYLLGLLVLSAIYLWAAIEAGRVHLILQCTAAALALLPGVVLLVAQSRWAILAIGLLTAWQALSFVEAYLPPHGTTFINPHGSDTVVYVVAITYIWGPLLLLGATTAVLLYSAWLWHRGVLG